MNPLVSLLITLGGEVLLVAGVGRVAERLLPSVRDRRRLWCAILSIVALLTVVELTGLRVEARRMAIQWLHSPARPTEPRRFVTEVVDPVPSAEVDPSVFAAEMPPPAETPAPSHWPTLLAALWLLGTVSILIRTGLTRWQLRKLVRQSQRVDVEAAGEIADRLGLARRRVQLREAAGFGGPVAFGILRPTVLLPRGFAAQHEELELKVLLAHELAHLAARDPLWLAISDVLTGLLWWHPAVWWARRRLRATSEAAADEASSLIPGGRIALAEALVAFGHQLTAETSPAGFGVGGLKSELAGRVTRLLSAPAHAASRLLTRVTLAGALGTILAIGTAPWPGEGAQPVLVAALESIESLESKPAAANGGTTEAKPESGPGQSNLRTDRTVQSVPEPNPIATRGSLESIETNRLGNGTLVGYDAKAVSNVAYLPATRASGDGGTSTPAQSDPSGADQGQLRSGSKSMKLLDGITLPFLSIPVGPLEDVAVKLQSMIRDADPEMKGLRVTVATQGLQTGQPLHMGSAPLTHMLEMVTDNCTTPAEWVLNGDEIVFRKIASGKWPLRTRQFHVDAPTFLALIRSRREKAGDTTLYADVQAEVRAFCAEQGVVFPEFKPTPGSTNNAPPQDQGAVFLQQKSGALFVRASVPDLDRIGRALSLVMSSPIASELETRPPSRPAPSSSAVETQGGPYEHSTYIALRDEDAKRAVANSPGMSRERIRARIDLIVLPEFVAEAGPLSEAVENMESLVRKISLERTGVNVLVNESPGEPNSPKESTVTLSRRVSLRSVSLRSALDALAAATTVPVAWAIEDYAVVFSKIPPESLRTRRYSLDPAQLVALVRPFQATGETNIQFAVREFLSTKGIEFPKLAKPSLGSNSVAPQNVSGSSPVDPTKDTPAIFFNNRNGDLFVRAYQADLDRIERLLFQENQLRRLKSTPSSNPSTTGSSINSTAETAAIRDLRDRLQRSENNLKELRTKYRERHPRVIEAVQAQNALEAELERATAPSKSVSPFPAPAPAAANIKVIAPESLTTGPRQIEVEIRFAGVRESNVSGLGLDWIFGNSTNKASVVEVGSAQELEATPSIAQDNRYRVDLLRTIGERAELSPEQFKALLTRLESQAGTELLTAPKVMTASGRKTKVAVTETRTLVDDVKAVSGSSTNKAAVQYQTRSVDLGPSVEFLPILEGDSLRMHLTAKVTEFLGYDDPKGQSVAAAQPGGKPLKGIVPIPHVRIRMAIADSTFPLGGTLALRGPLVTETVRVKDKVPVLGDVPLLGRLFRSESTSTYQKRLYVFVSPVEIDAAGRRK